MWHTRERWIRCGYGWRMPQTLHGDGGDVSLALLPNLLVLLTAGLEQLAVGGKGLVCELGLVLKPDASPWPHGIALCVAGP